MGTDTPLLDKGDTNSIKMISNLCGVLEFEQYDSQGSIVYYYKTERGFLNNDTLTLYDKYKKEIGTVRKTRNCNFEEYDFYDENKVLTNRMTSDTCCSSTKAIFYGYDKNIESIVNYSSECCEIRIDETDAFNAKISGATGQKDCGQDYTINEYDYYGKHIFTIKATYDCGLGKIKIFDANQMEVKLENKTIFNDGFTKIQLLLIMMLLFPNQQSNNNGNN